MAGFPRDWLVVHRCQVGRGKAELHIRVIIRYILFNGLPVPVRRKNTGNDEGIQREPERSPQQDTSDLFGDDDDEADTNSESDDFEEVHVPSGAAPEKAPPEVIEVDDDNEAQEDEEDDFLPSRVNKYAPINEPSGSSPRVPPAKRRRPDSPPTKLPARPNGPNVHPPSNYKPPPVNHAPPTLVQHGPHMPTYFNTSSNRNEPLAPSIINSEPLDEVAQEICILPPELPIDTRFESNMPQQAHKHYNGLLNKLVAQAVPGQARVKYSHTKLVDEFYGEGGKFVPLAQRSIRLTRDEKTGKVAACVRKKRIANLDVHSPKQNVDWRISINVEEPGNPAHTRRKDRISYTHQAFKIDLTQVTSSHNGPNQVRRIYHSILPHRGSRASHYVPSAPSCHIAVPLFLPLLSGHTVGILVQIRY
ncbi:mRNA capping enzyme, beta chain domain-containing protein [Rhizoctonia solani AG-1 IA]|uniref:mRNA-capping enzyme subunit beta n=1 Tax=Thanatephorus cucumeris (strain AG1-IA) TaxID=983506 RepID=L8WQF8_THACA|nr:mRNA capping enzyme, beta chain domain-containing protein [Rhizoctonia solani AG-1 IA]